MAKLAGRTPVRPGGVIKTQARASRFGGPRTFEGGAGHARDVKSELFLLAVSNFVSERTFYEAAGERDERYRKLIIDATASDPSWTAALLTWLRSEGNMRSASIVGAIEYGVTLAAATGDRTGTIDPAYLDASTPRRVLASVIQRADEPGEALGYWLSTYGKPVPKWLKRALGDAAIAQYTPYSALKYDGTGQAVRFGDVLEMSQIEGSSPTNDWHGKNALFKWLIDRKYGRASGDYGIEMLQRRQALDLVPVAERPEWLQGDMRADLLSQSGYTWESLSGWLQGPMTAQAWEALIPSMGYMALLRNLRNFDETGVSDGVAEAVIAKLTDPARVAKSRQLPMRFLSAYQMAPSDRWKHALGKALDLSLANVPVLDGRSLVLIDTSTSMSRTFSERTRLKHWDVSALFGIALAKSAQSADVYGFNSTVSEFTLRSGASVLSDVKRFVDAAGGGATYTKAAIDRTYRPGVHKRVIVLTDEQAEYDGLDVFSALRETVPCYTYNVAGYRYGQAPSGTATRHAVGGLSDAGFQMMRVLEARQAGKWPWEIEHG